jgi:hypothetical protein
MLEGNIALPFFSWMNSSALGRGIEGKGAKIDLKTDRN